MSENVIKLSRPRQLYVGEKEKEYIDIKERTVTDSSIPLISLNK